MSSRRSKVGGGQRMKWVSRWALAAALVQLVGAAALGEVFPFSRYTMYASVSSRDRGALPVVLADGVPADAHDFVGFDGLDPDAWRAPDGVPCTMEFVLHDAQRWIRNHAGSGGDVEITLAHRIVELRDGAVHQEIVVQQRGRARRAP